jgi:hypothetical protein
MRVSSKAMLTSVEVADLLSKQYDVDVDLEGGEFEFTGDVKAIRRIMRVFHTEDTDTTAKAE